MAKLTKQEVQLLLRLKKIRAHLLETLTYFKGLDEQDKQLNKMIDELSKNTEKNPLKTIPTVNSEIFSIEESLLDYYTDIKNKIEEIRNKRREKSESSQNLTDNISNYSKQILKNFTFSTYEIQRKAGYIQEKKDLPEVQKATDFYPRNQDSSLSKSNKMNGSSKVNDNDFLKKLEGLTQRKEKIPINHEYIEVYKILKKLNPEIRLEDIEPFFKSKRDSPIQLTDQVLNNALQKALSQIDN